MKFKILSVIVAVAATACISITASAKNAEPEFSLKSGTYNSTQILRINDISDADIYFTTDGSLPDESSEKYDGGAIVISQNTKVRTATYIDGVFQGYDAVTLKIRTAAPKASLASGTYDDTKTVKLTCVDKSAKIYYTTDGSVPNKNATLYTKPIKITDDTKLRYIAIRDGRTYSLAYSKTYTINSDVYEDEERQQLFDLFNAYRTANGLCELKELPELSEIAQQRAKECAQYFSHYRPNGSHWTSLLIENGLFREVRAENIVYYQATAQQAINWWKNSSLHNANMLNPDTRYLGFGYYNNGYCAYWVQMFIGEE